METTERDEGGAGAPDTRACPRSAAPPSSPLFYESSTRTRSSFELAGKVLGADVINIAAAGSSVQKGESLVDTVLTLQAIGADILVMRHPRSGAPYLASRHTRASVINAGDGWHAHPTQALLDLFTMRSHLGDVRGRKVVIIGDITHSRVARSNMWGLTTMGAHVVVCGPPTLLPVGLEGRTGDEAAKRARPAAGRDRDEPRPRHRGRGRGHDAAAPAGAAAGGPHPQHPRVLQPLPGDGEAAGDGEARRAGPAPGAGERRRRDIARRGARRAVGDRRAGGERRGRAHGPALPDYREDAA